MPHTPTYPIDGEEVTIEMPDLFAHALFAYTIGTVLSWRYDWLSPAYVTGIMAGAFVPDLAKIMLVIPSSSVETLTGMAFSWAGWHTTGGALIAVLIGTILVVPREQKRVLAVLSLGAVSHLATDALLLKVSGRTYAIFWPLSRYRPPIPGLYLSSQPEPTIAAVVLALIVFLVRSCEAHCW